MSAYLIFVGGTGARCMDALTYSLLAGCHPTNMPDCIKVLSVDSDMANKNLTNAREHMNGYKQFRNKFYSKADKPSDMASVDINLREWHTHPNGVAADQNYSLAALASAPPDVGLYVDALYTEAEQRINPDHFGYVAHPNLGTAVLHACMTQIPGGSEYYQFFQDICNDLVAGKVVRVLIVGSLFGGTGASAFPALLSDAQRYVNHNAAAAANRENLHIGAVMVAPYFQIRPDQNRANEPVRMNSDGFDTATKQALDYYSIYYANKFSAIYLLGSNPKHMVDELAAGGAEQEDPYMLLELDVAQCSMHYFSLPDAALETNHMFYQYIEITEENKLCNTWQDMGPGGNGVGPLARMLYFSFVVQLLLLPKFNDWKKHGGPEFYVKYAKRYMNTPEGEESLKQLENITLQYLKWMNPMLHQDEVIVKTVKTELFDKLMAGIIPDDPDDESKCKKAKKEAQRIYAKLNDREGSPFQLILNTQGDGIPRLQDEANLINRLNKMPEINEAIGNDQKFYSLIHQVYLLCCR